MKKIIYAKKPKNNYLIIDATIDALQFIQHVQKSVYIKYLVTEDGDLKTLEEISRSELKERFKSHFSRYTFNSLEELENALENGAFEKRTKRFENISDLDFTYILV